MEPDIRPLLNSLGITSFHPVVDHQGRPDRPYKEAPGEGFPPPGAGLAVGAGQEAVQSLLPDGASLREAMKHTGVVPLQGLNRYCPYFIGSAKSLNGAGTAAGTMADRYHRPRSNSLR